MGTSQIFDEWQSRAPDVEDLRLYTRANWKGMYGPGLTEFIDTRQPRSSFFGHIHNPRARQASRGARGAIVGYFKRHPVAYTIDIDELRPG